MRVTRPRPMRHPTWSWCHDGQTVLVLRWFDAPRRRNAYGPRPKHRRTKYSPPTPDMLSSMTRAERVEAAERQKKLFGPVWHDTVDEWWHCE